MDLCVAFQAKIKSKFKRSSLWLKLNQLKGQKAAIFKYAIAHMYQKQPCGKNHVLHN